MKAILEFNLPEEDGDFKITSTAIDWALTVWDIDQWLRNKIKYNGREEFQEIRDELFRILEDRNINLDMIQ